MQSISIKEKVFSFIFRKVWGWLGLLKSTPGDHACWQCKLYDTKLSACKIIIYRKVKRPFDKPKAELRRVWPFDPCIRYFDFISNHIESFDPGDPEFIKDKAIMKEKEKPEDISIKNEIIDRKKKWPSTSVKNAAGERPTKPN